MSLLERLAMRAARPKSLPGGTPTPGSPGYGKLKGTGQTPTGNVLWNASGWQGNGPVKAATITGRYTSPGQPMAFDWDATSAMDGAYYSSVYVMRCVRTIADTLASLEFRAGKNAEKPDRFDPNCSLARLLGPSPGSPNPRTASRALWAWTTVQYLVTGRFGWETQLDPGQKGYDGLNQIVGLWPLVSATVNPIPAKGGEQRWFEAYRIDTPYGPTTLKPEQICYAWRHSQRDWRQPESYLEAAKILVNLDTQIQRVMSNLMKNGLIGAHLVVSPPYEESEYRRAFQEQFLQEYTGYDNAGKMVFAEVETPDNAKIPNIQVTPLQTSPLDAEMLRFWQEVKQDLCVVPGTGIVTKRGVVPVEQVKVGDEVVTHLGRFRRVTDTMINQPSAPLRTLSTRGEQLTLTGNHPVYAATYLKTHKDTAYRYDGTAFVPADELLARGGQRSHAVTLPVMTPPEETGTVDLAALNQLGRRGNFWLREEAGQLVHTRPGSRPVPAELKLTPALGRLVGLYLAEGSCNSHQVQWSLGSDETDLHNLIEADVMEVFGCPVRRHFPLGQFGTNIFLDNARVVPLFKSMGTATNKTVPDWCFEGDRAFREELLFGWAAGDGHAREIDVRVRTHSESLAWQMRLMAISLGLRASLERIPIRNGGRIKGRLIEGKTVGWNVCWRNDSALKRQSTTYRIEGDVLTIPIRTIEPSDYKGPVHNLSVEEDESYLTVGGLVHNCISMGVPLSLIGNASQRCASSDTEILTRDGWKTHDQLRIGEQALTLDHETGMAEWQPVQNIARYEVTDQQMLHMKSQGHDSLTNAPHRWPVLDWRGKRAWKVSQTLSTHDRLITAAPVMDLPTEAKYSDDFVELVAWHWTEGHVTYNRPSGNLGRSVITQEPMVYPENCRRIESVLRRLFGEPLNTLVGTAKLGQEAWRMGTHNTRTLNRYVLSLAVTERLEEVAPDKVVTPAFIFSLTKAQLELFIEVSILADGWRSNQGSRVVSQAKKEMLEGFALAVLLTGRTPYRWSEPGRRHYVVASERGVAGVPPFKGKWQESRGPAVAEWVDYTGTIWCPSLPNGTWLARRGDTVFYTGNSFANADAEYREFWTLTMTGVLREMEDHINTQLAPRLGEEVGWFDVSQVEALRPPKIFAPPSIEDAVEMGIVQEDEVPGLLGIGKPLPESVETAPIGELTAGVGMGAGGRQMDVTPVDSLALSPEHLRKGHLTSDMRDAVALYAYDEQHSKQLDLACRSMRTTRPALVYRGASGFPLSEGDRFVEHRPVSTTRERQRAVQGAEQLVEILLPAGTRGIYVDDVVPGHEEFLLPSGSSFRVDDVQGDLIRVSLLKEAA